jgi:hypothetical protein
MVISIILTQAGTVISIIFKVYELNNIKLNGLFFTFKIK